MERWQDRADSRKRSNLNASILSDLAAALTEMVGFISIGDIDP